MATKEYHIGDVLTVTSGKLLSPRHMEGIYDILEFMTGIPPFTHQLPRMSDECTPSLREQFPELTAEPVPEKFEGKEDVEQWLASLYPKYGETVEVTALEPGTSEPRNPLAELAEMMGPDKPIIVIAPSE